MRSQTDSKTLALYAAGCALWWAVWAVFGAAGCDGHSSDPEPVPQPVTQYVEETSVPTGGYIYHPEVAAGRDGFLLTWTEHRQQDGDQRSLPDIFFQAVPPLGTPVTADPIDFTPYADAQLLSRPFHSDLGFGVACFDDAPAGYPDRRFQYRLLEDGRPVTDATASFPTTNEHDYQGYGTIAAVGTTAVAAYTDGSEDPVRRAGVIDLETGTVVREIELAPGAPAPSVVAGSSRFLLMWTDPADSVGPEQLCSLTAMILDAAGGIVWGPEPVSATLPSIACGYVEDAWPAGYYDGLFVVPTADYEVVTVDRPCCPECFWEQEPTCTITDFRLKVQLVAEDGGLVGQPECLDCRVDVGFDIPLVASGTEGVYFFWQDEWNWDLVARIRPGEPLPTVEQWRHLHYPRDLSDLVGRHFHGLAALDGSLALIGESRNHTQGEQSYSLLVVRFEYGPDPAPPDTASQTN